MSAGYERESKDSILEVIQNSTHLPFRLEGDEGYQSLSLYSPECYLRKEASDRREITPHVQLYKRILYMCLCVI